MRADFDPSQFPRKLNLGCGLDRRKGYTNVDLPPRHEPDLVADVTSLAFLPADYYDEVLAQDVLEHLPRTSTRKTLVHWNRLLAPAGLLRLRVPDALTLLNRLAARENQSVARQEALIQHLFGTQAYPGDFHFTSFTEVLLRHYLRETGFDVIAIETRDGNFDVTARKRRNVDPHDVGDFSDLLGIEPDERFVRECYRSILDREADPSGLAHYVAALTEGRIDRSALIDAMLNSDEGKALAAKRSA